MFDNFKAESPAHNEFRSDTFTTPTMAMVEALANATLGDAVYNEDDSTNQLQARVAEMCGKEAGLYCVSGTLSNQLGMRVNLFQPPYSVMCDSRAHVYVHEAGGMATLSQAMPAPIYPSNGRYLTLEDDIIPHFVPDDGEIHSAPTKLVCLENTLHGMLFPLEEIKKISEWCRANDVRIHLDGARLWNASVASGVSLADYCQYFDTVSLCLSKTLGAPVGSILVGDAKSIAKANHFKKQNGGGIRQSGLLAVMAGKALDDNYPKLAQTHEWAREVGDFVEANGGVLEHPVETNFVFIDFPASKVDPEYFITQAEKHNVRSRTGRMAFHYQLTREAVDNLKLAIKGTLDEAKRNPYEGTPAGAFYSSVRKK
ncbi:low specificity L-threonine aldolase [Diutina catenulata]